MTALITPEQRAQLLANGAAYGTNENFDPFPVLKLFTPDGTVNLAADHLARCS